MNENQDAGKMKVASELKRAIKNINRNLYDWRDKYTGRSMDRPTGKFAITYNEVYSLTRNWVIRCLRSVMDCATADRIFRGGHLSVSIDEATLSISKIWIGNYEVYRSYYPIAKMVQDILNEIDYKSLRYDPRDYAIDGVTERNDEFYYKPYEPMDFDVKDYDSLTPKN